MGGLAGQQAIADRSDRCRDALLRQTLPERNRRVLTRFNRSTQHLELLRSYAQREGHTSVPVDLIVDGLKLGQWARLRRREHTRLSAERQAQLVVIPGWFWGTKADQVWSQKFELLARYDDREGHIKPPDGHIEQGVKLGGWVREQWRGKEKMPVERSAKLESLPGWNWGREST
ncbi:hypothetical protein E5720_17640 [Rhodococcus sp. PAMC28707]|uniref:helicase associated domain-containing protein n=1 Tax=unclassified Rhodococcus (in: high G+C Gram-positive bacteria) TaxID=192944 RepID=UPI00109E1A03|nr:MULTISPECIES: helicase associated domain-containing protein [unclassified Rhodococcus (in: high G+C Gram-positive bacteria)]QCB51794.1 hypothetical protein E5769_17885 [Rhodococcus sp. PAMC28705]QCB60038.1 hypothetical protein E5720_17640 [Rhodococcus sp. PAMC28707]